MFANSILTKRSERVVGMPANRGRNVLAESWLPIHVTFEGCKPSDGYQDLPATSPVGVPSS